MESEDTKTCIVCGESKLEGITIVTQFICMSCESDIVRTNAEDERYSFFVHRLRKLWVRGLV